MEFYIGQIIMFGGNFAIRSFALANGQLLAINSNSALFSILGTTYGGDGRTTFGLPDLRGRVPVSSGNGPGLSDYRLGQRGGTQTHTMTLQQMASHNHTVIPSTVPASIGISSEDGTENDPSGNVLAIAEGGALPYTAAANADGQLTGFTQAGQPTIANNGGQQAFSILQPYLTINYEVCLMGIFPSRN